MVTPPPELPVRRRRAPMVPLVCVVSAGALLLGLLGPFRASRAAGSALRSASATRLPKSLGLPRLGASQVVEQDDVGDPNVLTVPAVPGRSKVSYVLYWTTDWQSNVPTAVSPDHVHWRRVADALPVLPSWAVPSRTMTWGPTVVPGPSGYILYFATADAGSGRQCLGRATSSAPTGPFIDTSAAPIVCQSALGGDIDPSVVTDASGARALLWKNDGNATGSPVGIWEQPLSTDGLAVTGVATRLIGADQPWEVGIVEGPAMLRDTRGGWWLLYSGGTWQSDTYDTGVAWCATTAGPCHDASPTPLLSSTPTAVSPGGMDTFVDGAGRLWASYSAFPSAPATAQDAMESNRVLEIAPVVSH